MEGTQETQKPTVTEKDLEQSISLCDKYLTGANKDGIAPESRLSLYAMATEAMPIATRGFAYAGLALAYAKEADKERKAGNYSTAKVYEMLAAQYLKQSGIEVPGVVPGAQSPIESYINAIQDKQYTKKEA